MALHFSVDFHCHTNASKDSLTPPEALVKTAHRCGLSRLVVTDHNTIAGALAAHVLDPEMVIIGEEIMSTQGEILAFFVTSAIQSGLSPIEVIKRLRDQGAFISISHPFDSWRSGSWDLERLLEIVPLVDALEVFNARSMAPKSNFRSLQFAAKYAIPGTAG